MKIRLAWLTSSTVDVVSISVGKTRDELRYVGQLALTPAEAVELRCALRGGGWRQGPGAIDGVFESGWDRADDD